jgi:hypothetical protein
MRTTITQSAPAASPPGQPRGLCAIIGTARQANCGHCWASPGKQCATDSGAPVDGVHLARIARACRCGLITRREFAAAVLTVVPVFWTGSVIGAQAEAHDHTLGVMPS